jgi:hypothetical protein
VTTRLSMRRGSLYLGRHTYERYFASLEGIVLLREHEDLTVMPVRLAGAGGYLVKVRNAAGDRVVDAADFFRTEGVLDDATFEVDSEWDDARGALVAARVFAGVAAP